MKQETRGNSKVCNLPVFTIHKKWFNRAFLHQSNNKEDIKSCIFPLNETQKSCFVHRDRLEREEAEQEGRQIQEEELDDENIQNPFQPINNVISEVCVQMSQHCLRLLIGAEVIVYFLFIFMFLLERG